MESRQLFEQGEFQLTPALHVEQQWTLAGIDQADVFCQRPLRARAVELAFEALRVEAAGAVVEQCRQGLFEADAEREGLQLREAFRAAALARRGERVEDRAAAEGALGAGVAQDQSIAFHCVHRRVDQQLREHALAGTQARALQQGDAGDDICVPRCRCTG